MNEYGEKVSIMTWFDRMKMLFKPRRQHWDYESHQIIEYKTFRGCTFVFGSHEIMHGDSRNYQIDFLNTRKWLP